jgi:hypothetical protein
MMKGKKSLVIILVALLSLALTATVSAREANYFTHLTGAEEVPPTGVVIDTLAQGQAVFHLSEDGEGLMYKLIVANIDNIVASHIHLAPAGQNGSVVAFLYGPAPAGGGRTQKAVIAAGTITADDLVGPLAGASLSDLIAAIEAGNAYVNVHTNDGVAPTNTGPGDFPGGEIRGQIH